MLKNRSGDPGRFFAAQKGRSPTWIDKSRNFVVCYTNQEVEVLVLWSKQNAAPAAAAKSARILNSVPIAVMPSFMPLQLRARCAITWCRPANIAAIAALTCKTPRLRCGTAAPTAETMYILRILPAPGAELLFSCRSRGCLSLPARPGRKRPREKRKTRCL